MWIFSKPQYGISDVNTYGTSIAFELKPKVRGSSEMQTSKLPAMWMRVGGRLRKLCHCFPLCSRVIPWLLSYTLSAKGGWQRLEATLNIYIEIFGQNKTKQKLSQGALPCKSYFIQSFWCHWVSSSCQTLIHTDKGLSLDVQQEVSNSSGKETGSVVDWHHNTCCWKLAGKKSHGETCLRLGKKSLSQQSLYPNKVSRGSLSSQCIAFIQWAEHLEPSTQTRWLDIDSIIFPPRAKNILLNKAL